MEPLLHKAACLCTYNPCKIACLYTAPCEAMGLSSFVDYIIWYSAPDILSSFHIKLNPGGFMGSLLDVYI